MFLELDVYVQCTCFCHELDNYVDFICIFVENGIISCYYTMFYGMAQFEQVIRNVEYVGGKLKLFVCNSNMDLNELKFHICFRIRIDSTISTVDINFKYGMN